LEKCTCKPDQNCHKRDEQNGPPKSGMGDERFAVRCGNQVVDFDGARAVVFVDPEQDFSALVVRFVGDVCRVASSAKVFCARRFPERKHFVAVVRRMRKMVRPPHGVKIA
jgi:hypothetical protein